MQSIKHHFISKFPNYLIISVNRFEYDVVEKRNKKNKAKIAINPILTINDISYQIYSIIIHTVIHI
jgi:ubiquitin C-terminal hydrolase